MPSGKCRPKQQDDTPHTVPAAVPKKPTDTVSEWLCVIVCVLRVKKRTPELLVARGLVQPRGEHGNVKQLEMVLPDTQPPTAGGYLEKPQTLSWKSWDCLHCVSSRSHPSQPGIPCSRRPPPHAHSGFFLAHCTPTTSPRCLHTGPGHCAQTIPAQLLWDTALLMSQRPAMRSQSF